MSPEYLKILKRLSDLVHAEELPKGAIPRIAYMGHTLVNSYGNFGPRADYKCVACHTTGSGDDFKCGCEKPEIYVTNHRRDGTWRCKTCEHEWTGEEGHTCPDCHMIAPTTWVKVLFENTGKEPHYTRGLINGPSKEYPKHMAIRLDPNRESTEWADMKDAPLAHFPNNWFDGKRITLHHSSGLVDDADVPSGYWAEVRQLAKRMPKLPAEDNDFVDPELPSLE